MADWRGVLRTNPLQGRQALRHLVGEIMLWVGDAGDLAIAGAARPGDRRGTEGITAADCGWVASAQIDGLLVGLPGFGAWSTRMRPQGDFLSWTRTRRGSVGRSAARRSR